MDCEELEIVQYKFASIIGGLCGKPKILSQFAVWLDLRLAEYKLKGAISLDCSGSTPDPDWLQGIKPDLSQQTQTFLSEHASVEQTEVSVLYGDGTHHSPSEQSIQPEQIKAEPYTEERVFPVEQYENVSFSGTNNSQSTPVKYRERTEHFTPPSSKHRKVVPSTSSKEDFSDVHVHAGTTLGSAAEPLEVTIDDDSESYESFTAGISGDISQAPSTSEDWKRAKPGDSENDGRLQSPQNTGPSSSAFSPLPPNYVHITDIRDCRRRRIKDVDNKPAKSVRNVLAAVGNFERWLWERFSCKCPPETRQIFEIPPEELDPYLETFFREIQKPQGGDFHHDSLRSQRSRLESYLKDNDYPESIIHSDKFFSSKIAYKQRIAELRMAASLGSMLHSDSPDLNSDQL